MTKRVRINEITITNIKNVQYGHMIMEDGNLVSTSGAGILGIYGQNGSGKTALLDALLLFKTLVSGEKLDPFTKYLINLEEKMARIDFLLSIHLGDKKYLLKYAFTLVLHHKSAVVDQEFLMYKEEGQALFNPLLSSDKENGYARHSHLFSKQPPLEGLELDLFNTVKAYGTENVLIINNFTNRDFRTKDEFPLIYYAGLNGYQKRVMRIKYGHNLLDDDDFNLFKIIVSKISTLLDKIIPGIHLEYKTYASKDKLYNVELVTRRANIILPLKYESIGVKKLVLVLGSLISMYNAENVMVAIDEIDAGIFEYLLGEIILVLKEEAKGQLLFTSHNLRPLEILNPFQILFTTANPKNRYIKIQPKAKKYGLRDIYIRMLELGGQKEDMQNTTDQFEISRAFRLAGEAYEE